MTIIDYDSILVVPPFECAWLSGENLLFPQPGRGCVCFEARADNDVTLTFKEHAGSRHYRMDLDRNYTVVLGSHKNRLLKIEADGRQVAEAPVGISNSEFERYWIDVCCGVITVGKGDPGQGMKLQWCDPNPNLSLQYVGLSSWDKHVAYRSVKVIHSVNFKQSREYESVPMRILNDYLFSPVFADVKFLVGKNRKVVWAHRIVLGCCLQLKFLEKKSLNGIECVELPSTKPSILKYLLRYAYTGIIKIPYSKVKLLLALSIKFGFSLLSNKCVDELARYTAEMDAIVSIPPVNHFDNPSTSMGLKDSTSNSKILTAGSTPDSDPAHHTSSISNELYIHITCSNYDDPSSELTGNYFLDKSSLQEIYLHGDFSDVSLFVENHSSSIKCHRLLLSLISPLFANMFSNDMKESRCGHVVLGDCSFRALKCILNYFYVGSFILSTDDGYGIVDEEINESDRYDKEDVPYLDMLSMADRLCLNDFKVFICEQLIIWVDPENACSILTLAARIPNCDKLCARCESVIAQNFDFCISSQTKNDFRNLTVDSVINILKRNEVTVSSEIKVFDAVILWSCIEHLVNGWVDFEILFGQESEIQRFLRPEIFTLLPLVRFPLMPLDLLNKLKTTSFSIQIPIFNSLVQEAIEYSDVCSKNNANLIRCYKIEGCYVKKIDDCFRFSHRLSNYHKLFYTKDGDSNGVCYFIGSDYGIHRWMNPVLTKKIFITSSSPSSRFTDPRSLVSGNFQNTSFVGPCIISGQKNSFWKFDFGETHQLMCNYYTLRQDGSSNFARYWVLEASVDDVNWVELRKHENDQTLSYPGQYASFPILGSKAYFPARYFRLRMYGPSSSKPNPWHLCLCYIEFYGYFR